MSKDTVWRIGGYEWKRIKIIKKFNWYLAISSIHTDDKTIPFGAVGFDKVIVQEKALSEMVERIAWYELFKKSPRNFKTTFGWAAYPEESGKEALFNSAGELLEYEMLMQVLEKNFNISLNKLHIINKQKPAFMEYLSDQSYYVAVQYDLSIDEDVLTTTSLFITLVISRVSIDNVKGWIIGTGRGESLSNSFIHALLEHILILNTFKANNFRKLKRSQYLSNLSVSEYNRFLSIFHKYDLIRNPGTHAKLLDIGMENIYSAEATEYLPLSGNEYKRVVYCSKRDKHHLLSVFGENKIITIHILNIKNICGDKYINSAMYV